MTLNILATIGIDQTAQKALKALAAEKLTTLSQEGRKEKWKMLKNVLGRAAGEVRLASSEEAEFVKAQLEEEMTRVGKVYVQFYLLLKWREVATKKVREILMRQNGTRIEIHTLHQFDLVINDAKKHVENGTNVKAFKTQIANLEAARERFAALKATHDEMSAAVTVCKLAEGDETAKEDIAVSASPASSKRKSRKRNPKPILEEKAEDDASEESAPVVVDGSEVADSSASEPVAEPVMVEEPVAAE